MFASSVKTLTIKLVKASVFEFIVFVVIELVLLKLVDDIDVV